MRVEGLSANKTSHFSVILEVGFCPQLLLNSISAFKFNLLSSFSFTPLIGLGLKVFEVAPTFFMVDIQKAAGDAGEYLKVSYLVNFMSSNLLLTFFVDMVSWDSLPAFPQWPALSLSLSLSLSLFWILT